MNPQALAFLQQQMLGQYALMNGLVAPSSSSAAEPMARTTSKVVLAPPTSQPAHDQVRNFTLSRASSFDYVYYLTSVFIQQRTFFILFSLLNIDKLAFFGFRYKRVGQVFRW
jgi:hypothetical protein